MVIKSSQATMKEFRNVKFEVLATGNKSMITKMLYRLGDKVPVHTHPNEQSGYIISGIHRINISGIMTELSAGDSYTIPENTDHSWEVIEAGEVIDFFTPPRTDYL